MRLLLLLAVLLSFCATNLRAQQVDTLTLPGRWSVEKANAWYDAQPWLVGANYLPRTAINQLEMWQGETWDPTTIRQELGWAADIGMNTMRVYLHDLVWRDDKAGLYERMDAFLEICQSLGIRPAFVFFDDCHEPEAKSGPQPLPVPGFHNSGWVTSPGVVVVDRFAEGSETDADRERLRGYIQETLQRYGQDERVLLWELYNEPGCDNFYDSSNKLLYAAWQWARAAAPSQPLVSTSLGSRGVMNEATSRNNSDVHSIHTYSDNRYIFSSVNKYRADGRPVIVSEWLARTYNSNVFENLPLLKALNVGAINWGLVAGKSGTVFGWHSRNRFGTRMWPNQLRARGEVTTDWESEPLPEVFFHDLFYPDGRPYDEAEIKMFRQLTGR
ncbi:cellulase family glycosylhydrolase [Lewinella sp. 4G2]|uniref:cellulase family glycosylhydrolase n=1 Tax=Lewinella sp. 4G2 TaxID=1803372 RepID=UPI0007B4DE74|nr:cellulase family glycosylhydrolase [Lewinella sp. 4G2]OAV43619.1 hypothetical protein A3850_003515 [Lewinella sp. 4G2]